MIHALIVLVLSVPALYFGFPEVPVWLFGFYVGREIAQAEYRYIEQYCHGKRANMPWYAPFTIKAWTVKGVLDWLLPALVAVALLTVYFKYLMLLKT